jgi:predicted ester cyclase
MALGTRTNLDRIPLEIFNKGRYELIEELYAPEYVDRTPLTGFAATRDGLEQAAMALKAGFPDLLYTIDDVIYTDDKIVHRLTGSGTMTGDFLGMPATGKRATWTEIHIGRLVNDRVVEHWGVADLLNAFVQLGVIPAPGKVAVAA